jgi:hypothetical protein
MIMTTLRCAPLKNHRFFGRFASLALLAEKIWFALKATAGVFPQLLRKWGHFLDLEKNPRLGAQSIQNLRQRTKPGEGSLQKIGSDEGRKQQPISGLNNRQENTSENKNSRKSNDQPINCHFLPPIFGCFQKGSDSKIFNLEKMSYQKMGCTKKGLDKRMTGRKLAKVAGPGVCPAAPAGSPLGRGLAGKGDSEFSY